MKNQGNCISYTAPHLEIDLLLYDITDVLEIQSIIQHPKIYIILIYIYIYIYLKKMNPVTNLKDRASLHRVSQQL
jgi:hypothetical protein